MDSLLFEIGTEEIPAGYIEPALKALASHLLEKMNIARIDHGNAMTYGTPRRLAVIVENVVSMQQSLTIETIGPPERIGFDEHGNYTVAAKKFAEKVGISINRIHIKETKKGPYLCARKLERGLATRTLLKSILPDVIHSIPFPKRMKWADFDIEFARPIHSILALLGDMTVPFAFGNIKSGRHTSGHSFMHPGKIRVSDSGDYVKILRSAHVLVDPEERKEITEGKITNIVKTLDGTILPDAELMDIVNNLIEYPVPVAGKFDPAFLDLPPEVLITAMREHQKYFAVTDKKNRLMPYFVAVNNTLVNDMTLVAKGHERVLRARLKDAQFFYQSDLKISFKSWVEKLKGVLFQSKIGSMYEKVLRVQEIAEFIACAVDRDPDLKNQASRAAWLCKADLVSKVVVEFPKLQGVMGRVYAQIDKEGDVVAAAIEEHYRPIYSGGPLPETMAGSILSIADKMDSICGCFSVGLLPTGAADPYALRRQGIGIVQIMLERGFSFSIKDLIEKSAGLFSKMSLQETNETVGMVYTFLQNRISRLLAEEGFSKDVIAAVVHVSVENVPDVWKRVGALETLKKAPDFEPLAIAFKRVVNIIKQAGNLEIDVGAKDLDEHLFQDECEAALYFAYKEVEQKVMENLKNGLFSQALKDIASLRDFVDAFFDGVMVLTDDIKIRDNRLSLLGRIAALFGKFADFSQIST